MSKWSVMAERAWAAGDPGSPQPRRRAADTRRYTVRREHRPQRWAYMVGDWHDSRRSEPRGYHDTAVELEAWRSDQERRGRLVVLDVDWSRSLLGGRARAIAEPTGRHLVPAWEAVLMASPAKCFACSGYGGHDGRGEPATTSEPRLECRDCSWTGLAPGHDGAREALDHLSERLFEVIRRVNDHGVTMEAWHPDVAGDALLDLGETWAMVLAGCPRLPVWLASWMHGKCAECDGAGERERGTEWARDEFEAERAALDLHAFGANANVRYVTVHNRRDDGEDTGVNLIRYVRCDVCGGTGSSIGQHAGAIEAYLDCAGGMQRDPR